MIILQLFQIFLLTSCTSVLLLKKPENSNLSFTYVDESGRFKLQREIKNISQKVVTRNQLFESQGSSGRLVEKSIMLSQIGTIQKGTRYLLTFKPLAAEFTTWLEGKKYSSKMEIVESEKSMKVMTEGPQKELKGEKIIKFPQGQYFCFYGQLPECLLGNQFLIKTKGTSLIENFYLVWENWPFVNDQFSNMSNNLFVPANLKFDGEINNLLRYIVEVEGQMILFHFTKSFEFKKMAWINQGITVTPPGEEVEDEE